MEKQIEKIFTNAVKSVDAYNNYPLFFNSLAKRLTARGVEIISKGRVKNMTPYSIAFTTLGTIVVDDCMEDIVKLATWLGAGVYDDFLAMALPDENVSLLLTEKERCDYLLGVFGGVWGKVLEDIDAGYRASKEGVGEN